MDLFKPEKRTFPRKLTDKERLERSADLVGSLNELETMRADKKQTVSDFNANIEEVENKIYKLVAELDRGSVDVEVDCVWKKMEGIDALVRKDTGEIIERVKPKG